MSDTAKELRDKLDAALNDKSTSEVRKLVFATRIAWTALARIEQLERGIERANERACETLSEDHPGWFDVQGLTAPQDDKKRTVYPSLMQLIEELGSEY